MSRKVNQSDEKLIYFGIIVFIFSAVGYVLSFILADILVSFKFLETICSIQPHSCGNPNNLSYEEILDRQWYIFYLIRLLLTPLFFIPVYYLSIKFWFNKTNLRSATLKVSGLFGSIWFVVIISSKSATEIPVLIVACIVVASAIQFKVISYMREVNVT
jgi:hypothetical protein